MRQNQSFFNRLRALYATNPAMVWAIGWVSVVPSLGSLITLKSLYSYLFLFDHTQFLSWGFVLIYTLVLTFTMGIALLPTTFLAILSGFMFGWISFPFLVVGYTFASIVGYQIGKKVDNDGLTFLLNRYPKAAKIIDDTKEDNSELVFYVRLSPVIPFALSNLLFAFMKISLRKVVWVGLIGMLPRTLMVFTTGVLGTSLLGAFQEEKGAIQLLIIAALLLISIGGIYRYIRKRI